MLGSLPMLALARRGVRLRCRGLARCSAAGWRAPAAGLGQVAPPGLCASGSCAVASSHLCRGHGLACRSQRVRWHSLPSTQLNPQQPLRRAGGEGVDTPKHAATLTKGRPGVLHGSYSYVIQDEEGQVVDPHSISAG